MAKIRVLTTTSPTGLVYIQTTDAGAIACGCEEIDTSPGESGSLTLVRIVDRGTTLPDASQKGTWSAPFKTLKQAITSLSTHGGTILAIPGDYTAEGTITIGDTDNTVQIVNAACLWNSIYLPASGNEDAIVSLPAITASGAICLQGVSLTLPVSAALVWLKYSGADNVAINTGTLVADHSAFTYANKDPSKFLSVTQSLCASECQFIGGGGAHVATIASASGTLQIVDCEFISAQTWICTDDATLYADCDPDSAGRFSQAGGILTKIAFSKRGTPLSTVPQSAWVVPAGARTKGDAPVVATTTVTGANPGDYVLVAKPVTTNGFPGLVVTGTVTAANTVTLVAYCLADCVVPSGYSVRVACLPASPWSAP